MLYTIRKNIGVNYKVVLVRTSKTVFYGTKRECEEWLERNGHDEWN
jgi:hypothetical protein